MNSRLFSLATLLTSLSLIPAAELRLGIIGLDTSHVTAFTEILNNPNAKNHIPGTKVVGSPPAGRSILKTSKTKSNSH